MSVILLFDWQQPTPPGQGEYVQFIDVNGDPLPAGVQVSIYEGAGQVGAQLALSQYLGQGATTTTALTSDAQYTAIFSGSQAPEEPLAFYLPTTQTPGEPVQITVPQYISPDPSQAQYAQLMTILWPRDWFSDAARSSGGVAYNLAWALSAVLANLDIQQQTALQGVRLQSSRGLQVDSWVYDFFGNRLPRQPNESDSQYISRAIANLSAKKSTYDGVAALAAYYGTASIIEPWNPEVTGGWDSDGSLAYDGAGAYGAYEPFIYMFCDLSADVASGTFKDAMKSSRPLGVSFAAVSVASDNTGTIL